MQSCQVYFRFAAAADLLSTTVKFKWKDRREHWDFEDHSRGVLCQHSLHFFHVACCMLHIACCMLHVAALPRFSFSFKSFHEFQHLASVD